VSRDSHIGYVTTSSPLITTTTIPEHGTDSEVLSDNLPRIPTIQAPANASTNVSPHSHPVSGNIPVLPMPGLTDRADSLRPDSDSLSVKRKSISTSFRGKSPGRKIKEVFSSGKSQKSPRTSPDRSFHNNLTSSTPELVERGGNIIERRSNKHPEKPDLPQVDTGRPLQQNKPTNVSLPSLEIDKPPRTPPSATLITPQTTVTPPTPTDPQPKDEDGSPRRNTGTPQNSHGSYGIVVSPSGNMISHKRGQSTGSLSQSIIPSKLSNSVSAPLAPTVEEQRTASEKGSGTGNRNVTPGGSSFFSSWVSAAQNAATQVTNAINNTQQNTRSRSGTGNSEPESTVAETIKEESIQDEEETPKKQLAIETLGSGDLDFTHLGLDAAQDEDRSSLRPELEALRRDSTVKRDEAAAKIEDMLAKRAVSQAYEKTYDQTPVAEVPDPMNSIRHTTTFGSMSTALGGGPEKTTPNGSIFEGETGSIKRNNSVRSKMTKRRSRGSSIATGHSTIGAALVSASTSTLANPAKGPTLSGFAIAPKQRNRNFHQQFRSVPEDDYLIEDYSCALQKEILLAGRIYISEGHICFSSNILGWVTTLVISFEEVVSIERESTAMVFPNAIAIQTLHARHTFRSLLSREATYDLMIGIWKVSHPAAFKKSVNGKAMEQEASREVAEALGANAEKDEESEEDDEDEDDSDDNDDRDEARSFANSEDSAAGSAPVDMRNVARKPSAMNGAPMTAGAVTLLPGETSAAPITTTAAGDTPVDFPGPATHAATDCNDSATHYDRIVKDEIIAAPLGKIYSLLYGPQSGAFVRKYLLEEQKVTELVLEDDKTGLNNDIKSRQYTYIKPLGGSIGPKQTKCITTENLDFFDLEKSVSVTCTTQTPDVPSGNAFSVKTRYCLSWSPGNSTRLQMNCGIEWTAKSWLKGPIEKGANDGQQAYGDGLVKVLKSGLVRPRATTQGSKGGKSGKKKSKRDKGDRIKEREAEAAARKQVEDWGIFEPARGVLGPVVGLAKPVMNSYAAFSVIGLLLFMLWFRKPASAVDVGFAGGRLSNPAHRFAAYEEMWRKEESELWDWLEDRVGMGILSDKDTIGKKFKAKNTSTKSRTIETKLREERMSEREMEDAIRVTRERLSVLQKAVEKQKARKEL
jgi:VAD1 Analog of StAR-related lipid transfer domain/GRAM domain